MTAEEFALGLMNGDTATLVAAAVDDPDSFRDKIRTLYAIGYKRGFVRGADLTRQVSVTITQKAHEVISKAQTDSENVIQAVLDSVNRMSVAEIAAGHLPKDEESNVG